MPLNDFEYEELTKTLTDAFNALADEVQLLGDRKTILEHKLRYAHESYQSLADKYAQDDAETSKILAQLHLAPDVQVTGPDRTGFVPLPLRNQPRSKQETALTIRDGRAAAKKLAGLVGRSGGSTASGERSISGSSNMRISARPTSLSTVLEQDFTIPGKKSSLLCPFAVQPKPIEHTMNPQTFKSGSTLESDTPLTPFDPTPHQSSDPICAAMYAETMNSPPPSVSASAAKCPIRYLDQHSPEEVAQYFETHKHEIPRSHEVCVKRYQRNEQDIRMLDAKYGNLVSMIQGLGQKHQPMLPSKEEVEDVNAGNMDVDGMSDERVKDWAKGVSSDGIGHEEEEEDETRVDEEDEDRDSRFDRDRPLKEIRVGESPSRPWGISVPHFDPPSEQRAISPPPAPVSAGHLPKPAGRCPFSPGQETTQETTTPSMMASAEAVRAAPQCPFERGQKAQPKAAEMKPKPTTFIQPTFINPLPNAGNTPEATKPAVAAPQMVFTGPVFIGYPLEQAMQLMQQWKST